MWASLDWCFRQNRDILSVLSIINGLERSDEWLAASVGADPHDILIVLEPVVHCNVHAHAFCVGPLIAGITSSSFLYVTSSEHIAHGNCGGGPGLDAMSPH